MKRLLLPYLFTSVALLNAETTITEGNLTFTFPEGWEDNIFGYDIVGPTPHSFYNGGHAVGVLSQGGFYSYSLNTLIESNFSDPQISPIHTLSGGERTNYLDAIIDKILSFITVGVFPNATFTYLNNENGLIVRKHDTKKQNMPFTVVEYRYLIYLFFDNNSVVSWVVNVDTGASNEATSADIQQLDLVAQNATTTQPKQEYEPVVTYTEEEYNAVVTQRDARPTQADYDAVVADRNSRPTQAAYDSVVAERNARLTQSEVRDLRLGSSMLEVADGDASINIELEATDNLGITSPTWTPVPESKVIIHPNYQSGKIRIDVEADDASNSGVRFFRFKMNDSDSSNRAINVSIGESEYDETALREALAELYGVPLELVSLSVINN